MRLQRLSLWGLSLWGLSVIGAFQGLGLAIAQPDLAPAPQPLDQRAQAAQLNRPRLQSGSQGPEVLELQAALYLLGFYRGAINGIYSRETAQAVTQFQAGAGLNPDGVMDQTTWNRLFPPSDSAQIRSVMSQQPVQQPEPALQPDRSSATSSVIQATANSIDSSSSSEILAESIRLPVLKFGMRGEAVTGLQERLRAKGFLQGQSDGVFGPATEEAVQAAQRQFQLAPDGVVGRETWMMLLRP
ncbi:MAG: peptidoglycan-binding domain-containing protein [Microcoleaceae cyanobacterium]